MTGLSEDVAALERNFSDKLEELNDLRRRYATMTDDMNVARRHNNERVARIAELEKENDRLVKIIDRNMEEKRSLATRLGDMSESEVVLNATIREMKELIDNYEDRNVRLEIEIAKLRGVPPPTRVSYPGVMPLSENQKSDRGRGG